MKKREDMAISKVQQKLNSVFGKEIDWKILSKKNKKHENQIIQQNRSETKNMSSTMLF